MRKFFKKTLHAKLVVFDDDNEIFDSRNPKDDDFNPLIPVTAHLGRVNRSSLL